MNEEPRRALTDEEWAVLRALDGRTVRARLVELADAIVTGLTRHGLAAVALDRQPFGFSWAMVDALRDEHQFALGRNKEAMEAAIRRIEALLPPREAAEAERAAWIQGEEPAE